MLASQNRRSWVTALACISAGFLLLGIVREASHQSDGTPSHLWPFHGQGAAPTARPLSGQSDASYPKLHGQLSGAGLGPDASYAGVAAGGVPSQAQAGHPMKQEEPTFFEIATKHGTDKVTDHGYQDMYEHYLPTLRHKPIKMLEIGLGCDMSYGPGASYHLWLEYFTNVDLYFLEYDADCAAQWAHKTTGATIITGDQADPTVLEQLIVDHGADFDIIIDDGGHTMIQQQTSLEHLWKAVKPGGIYFCEDLQTSYWDRYGGGAAAVTAGTVTMMQYISLMIEDLTWGERRVMFPEAESVVHIDCSREVCAFRKRGMPSLIL